MDYQALGLGEAASVVTAVTVDHDAQTITISCLYDPQDTQMPYALCFQRCEHVAWQIYATGLDLRCLEAELIGIALETSDGQPRAVLTTEAFELAFSYQDFLLHTPTSIADATRR